MRWLLERYATENETRKIFREDHSPLPYYVCALTWYMFDKYLREQRIDKRFWAYRAHLFLIFRHIVGQPPPRLLKSKVTDAYCEKILAFLKEPQLGVQVNAVLDVFDKTYVLWTQSGGSRFGIKDNKEFTSLLLQQAARRFVQSQPAKDQDQGIETFEGELIRIIWRNGVWFGFIGRGFERENVYFDSRGYLGEPRELVPTRRVRFEIVRGSRGLFARNVIVCD